MTETFLWIYEDPTRELALVRGKNVRVVLDMAADGCRWSHAGKGFVVPLAAVADIVAAAQYADVPCRTKQVAAR